MAAAAAAARIDVAMGDLGKQFLKDDDMGDIIVSTYEAKLWWPYELSGSSAVVYGILEVNKDWSFLSMLCESIHQWMWMDAEGGSLLKLLALKIEAVADEIAQKVEDKKQLMKIQFRESEFLELVSYYQTETGRLMTEIRGDVENLSAGCSLRVRSPLPCPRPSPGDDTFTFWTSFVGSLLLNLRFIYWSAIELRMGSGVKNEEKFYALYKEVKLIRDYIVGVCSNGIDFPALAGGDDDNAIIIDDFINHVASVIVSSAIESCNYWFRYKTTTTTTKPPIEEDNKIWLAEEDKKIRLAELVADDLRHEIHLANPKFVEMHLHFLIALSKIERYQGGNFVHHFCEYLFKSTQHGFEKEVSSLLTCFIENMLNEEEQEVDQSFCPEINAVILWMASLSEAVRKKEEVDLPPHSELFIEIYLLLKAELFLKKLLHRSSLSSNIFFMISAEKYQTEDEFKQIPINLRDALYHCREDTEYGNKALNVLREVFPQVASLCQSFEAKKISKSTLKNSILQLLLKIVILRVGSVLERSLLFKSNYTETSFLADGKNPIELLLEQLNFLKPIISSKQVTEREDVHIILAQIEAVLRWITGLHYSNFSRKKCTKDMIKMILPSSELLDKVKHLKSMLIEIGPQFPLSKFPETPKLWIIDFVFTNLGELLKYNSIAPLKHYIEEIQVHLESLSSFLNESHTHEHTELKNIGHCAANTAYKVEYVFDSIVDEGEAQWHHFSWLYNLLEELRLLNIHASGIHLTAPDAKDQNASNVTQVSHNMISRDGVQSAINDMVMDLRDEELGIIEQLTKGSLRIDIVSIVGMPGIGKTTLARKVYNNQNIMHYFHCCAWCYVSQVYEKRELLLGILRDIHGLTDKIWQMTNEDLELKLRQCLLKKKYLIVLDDVWDAGAWNDLKNSFPDDMYGSRILITSRLRDVALEIKPNGDPHSLRPLSDDESWNLLKGKVFQGQACPQELLLVGKEIAQKCGGLPLAVVAISGLLRRTEKNKALWENISESLSSEIMKDREARCIEIMELSYKHLPEYLKACFLYLGVFLQDRDIPVSKLLWFWQAEGFIEKTVLKSLDDTAEAYLEDLVNRSLVTISKRRSNGKVKTCHLHDLILDFCRSKAKAENFLQLVTECDQPYASFPSSDYGFEFDFYHHLELVPYEAYRLSILLKRNHFFKSRPSGLGTRSLIFFASADSEPRCPYDISFVCHDFRLLRVLDVECINIGVSFPVEIKLLFRLRYLAVSGYMHHIPKSISNLSELETLIVKGLGGKVVLPNTIWYMTKLRHLHVDIHVAFELDDEELGDKLENLVSFSCPSLSCGEDTEKIMKWLPNLRKLKCIFFESHDSPKNCNQFPRLNFLDKLESLKIFYCGNPLNTSEFSFPLNLKELSLSDFRLPWNRISVIGMLPNLAVLKLLCGAFVGQRWDMKKEEFRELKFLKLEKLNISQWNACCDDLPKLERLVIQNCKDLEKIPCDFEGITTLEIIEVHWCGQSVEESAKTISQEANNGMGQEIKVLISGSNWKSLA